MANPEISVIISVYEQPQTLELALAALAQQDFRHPFEIIVCDDGSSPNMLQVCRRATDALNLDLRFVWQPDREYRLARSRNNAIRCAQGDLLVFLDGDIVVKPDFLRRHCSAHDRPRLIVCGPRKWVRVGLSARADAEAHPPSATEAEERTVDVSQLLSQLEKAARNAGPAAQLRWFQSSHPWLACVGCCFSVEPGNAVHFDEAFVGWGPEDRELVCRLVHHHDYAVSYRDDIQVFHLESSANNAAPFDPVRPTAHHDIVRYLKNQQCFRSLYPELDLLPALRAILRYRLNPKTDMWERIRAREVKWESGTDLSPKIRDRIEIALQEAEIWLQSHPEADPR